MVSQQKTAETKNFGVRITSTLKRFIFIIKKPIICGLLLITMLAFICLFDFNLRTYATLGYSSLTRHLVYHPVIAFRRHLLDRKSFRKMLVKHEKKTILAYQNGGPASLFNMYHYRINVDVYSLHTFYDIWETYIRTDIVNGRPLTSFMIRLGFVPDRNAEAFFSKQMNKTHGKTSADAVKTFLSFGNWLFDIGVLSFVRLNITESDETSSITGKRYGTKIENWERQVKTLHQSGKGTSFSKQ
jgi:hypothetical protein